MRNLYLRGTARGQERGGCGNGGERRLRCDECRGLRSRRCGSSRRRRGRQRLTRRRDRRRRAGPGLRGGGRGRLDAGHDDTSRSARRRGGRDGSRCCGKLGLRGHRIRQCGTDGRRRRIRRSRRREFGQLVQHPRMRGQRARLGRRARTNGCRRVRHGHRYARYAHGRGSFWCLARYGDNRSSRYRLLRRLLRR